MVAEHWRVMLRQLEIMLKTGQEMNDDILVDLLTEAQAMRDYEEEDGANPDYLAGLDDMLKLIKNKRNELYE